MPRTVWTRRSVLGAVGTTVGVAGMPGCLDVGSSTDELVTMTEAFAFDPATATVESGQTLTWRNSDAVEHTVTAYEAEIPTDASYFASGGFDSEAAARSNLREGLLAPDETFQHTFEQTGTYEYFCIPHEGSGMVGTVRVQ